MRLFPLLAAFLLPFAGHAQWTLQHSGTGASLRGVHSLGNGVAWASGTNGTVLRTADNGTTWNRCATPPGAEKLDFRGVQGFDAETALVLSSGTGDLSRIYKTADGCRTWKEVFRNPDAKGFFDDIHRVTSKQVFVVGDPVDGKFAMFTSRDAGDTWFIADDPGLDTPADTGIFAASNSSLINIGPYLLFGTGGLRAAVYGVASHCDAKMGSCNMSWKATETPVAHGPAAAGIFSLAGKSSTDAGGRMSQRLVAVGGQYDKPGDGTASAAFSSDGGEHWTSSSTMPSGYRSALAFDPQHNLWITVGPNGTDISADDGRNWRALKPGANDAPDADRNWNALSLPFVVGPKGRIGILNEAVLGASKP